TDPSGLVLVADGADLANEYVKWLRGEGGVIKDAGFTGPRITGVDKVRLADCHYQITYNNEAEVLLAWGYFRAKGWWADVERMNGLLDKEDVFFGWQKSRDGAYWDTKYKQSFDIYNRPWPEILDAREKALLAGAFKH